MNSIDGKKNSALRLLYLMKYPNRAKKANPFSDETDEEIKEEEKNEEKDKNEKPESGGEIAEGGGLVPNGFKALE